MPVSLAGRPARNPKAVYRSCSEKLLDTSWWGRPSSYECALGTAPGEAWVLMLREDLDRISAAGTFTDLYDLVFASETYQGPSGSATLKSLTLHTATCVVPGAREDKESVYLCRLLDKRHFLARVMIDKAYNMRHVLHKEMLATTLNGGTAWTWTQLVADLWAASSLLGTYPGLPFTPDPPPEDVELYQVPLSQALDYVLGRIGCALAYNPLDVSFSIVQVGATDAPAEAALARWDRLRHWDLYNLTGVRATYPEQVRVLFRRLPHVRGESSPFYALDRSDPTSSAYTSGLESGSKVTLPDDLEALYDHTGALTNGAALATRADERALDYYRALHSLAGNLERVYPLPLSDRAILPGAQVSRVRWLDLATATRPWHGVVTEVRRHGEPVRQSWPDVTIDPLTQIVRLTGGETSGLLDGYIQAWDPATKTFVDRDQVWCRDANS